MAIQFLASCQAWGTAAGHIHFSTPRHLWHVSPQVVPSMENAAGPPVHPLVDEVGYVSCSCTCLDKGALVGGRHVPGLPKRLPLGRRCSGPKPVCMSRPRSSVKQSAAAGPSGGLAGCGRRLPGPREMLHEVTLPNLCLGRSVCFDISIMLGSFSGGAEKLKQRGVRCPPPKKETGWLRSGEKACSVARGATKQTEQKRAGLHEDKCVLD